MVTSLCQAQLCPVRFLCVLFMVVCASLPNQPPTSLPQISRHAILETSYKFLLVHVSCLIGGVMINPPFSFKDANGNWQGDARLFFLGTNALCEPHLRAIDRLCCRVVEVLQGVKCLQSGTQRCSSSLCSLCALLFKSAFTVCRLWHWCVSSNCKRGQFRKSWWV